jgi:hypothetical protein
MLVFLVLCAFLQTLQGASVPSSHAYSPVSALDVPCAMASECSVTPGCGGPQCRTVYSILQSCLLTIFACVWTSAHPNINGPRDSGWTRLKRRVITMLCAVISPEMVVFWALCQHSAAKEIAEKYNTEFASFGMWSSTLFCGFGCLISEVSRRDRVGAVTVGKSLGLVPASSQRNYAARRRSVMDYNTRVFRPNGWLHLIRERVS